jgi:hypothetical protein
VGTDEHLSELDEITVLLVIDLDDTPGVLTTTNFAAIRGSNLVGSTNNSEGDLGHDFVVLCDRLLVVELISGALEDLDAVVLDVGKDLLYHVNYY